MLEPNERKNLLQSLRPPAGYELDFALGTTYSLDLQTMLAVPFAFSFFEWESEEGAPTNDPVLMWEALRRHVDRLYVFCQAGQIRARMRRSQLYSYLEDSVIEVTAPHSQGAFHPKVWVLRFTADGRQPLYRVLCMSRNLTFDRSWDTICALEGELTDRTYAYSRNHPLGDFIEALPELAVRPLPDRVQTDIERAQSEVRRVDFRLPPDVEEIRFWPLGLKNRRKGPFDTRIDRLIVMAPFLSSRCLKRLAEPGRGDVLISRPESLDELEQGCWEAFDRIFVMDDAARPGAGQHLETDEASHKEDESLDGLHAKLFVADAGWDARVWTGSANATTAAFERNVEFLIELQGKKSRIGIDAFLGAEDDEISFRTLLRPYQPSEEAPSDALDKQLENEVAKVKRALAQVQLEAVVSEEEGNETFRVAVRSTEEAPVRLPRTEHMEITCWPIMLSADRRVPLQDDGFLVEFSGLSFEALTSFFAFEISVEQEGREKTERFVLNLPLRGAPRDRKERILRFILRDQKNVFRLILLLLADDGLPVGDMIDAFQQNARNFSAASGRLVTVPLLETMLCALHRSPAKLDRVEGLISDLKRAEGEDLIPKEFEEVWAAIREVRSKLPKQDAR